MKVETKRKLAQLTKNSVSFGFKIGSFRVLLMIVFPKKKPKKLKYKRKKFPMYA